MEAVKLIAEIGYDGVELLADSPHLDPFKTSSDHLFELAASIRKLGLRVANVNANTAMGYYNAAFWEPLFEPSLANPERDKRQWRIAYTKRCLDFAEALGADCISITSGRAVPGTRPDDAVALLRESLEEVLVHAEKVGVRVGMEYEPGLLIERCEELVELMDTFRCPFFGANLDLGHSHVLGESPEKVVAALSPRIFHIHLEDIRGRKHYHLIPGLGDMDFSRLFDILDDNAYEGFATVELYTYPQDPVSAAGQALRYLRNLDRDRKPS